MPRHIYRKLIRESMIDSMGHVNNSTYLQICEEARWEWCTEKGVGYDFVKKNNIGFAVLEANLRFSQEIHLRQKIHVITDFVSYRKKIGHVQQTLCDENDNVYCTASFKVGLFDLKTRRLIEPSDSWLKAMEIENLYEK